MYVLICTVLLYVASCIVFLVQVLAQPTLFPHDFLLSIMVILNKGSIHRYRYPGFRIRIHLTRIWIQHFRLITDPDQVQIRIQSGYRVFMTKN
jgi:hypothetical protein